MSNKKFVFCIFVFGIVIGIIAANILMLAKPTIVYADATSGSDSGMIAVTGLCYQGCSGLWVIDTRDTDTTPAMCLYMPDNQGRNIKLAAARRIKWDFHLLQHQDNTDKKLSPETLKKQWQEYLDKTKAEQGKIK